ncbi:MFS transporter [Paenibacillus riograndensis]|uniref:Transporter, major facilitator family protein n=3 Tax=Paenibacillus riograndensis TaxID=483937 RepID=A0A0E3WHC2_9BACL|nr:MFS transporter [Paenibacillus riograndensis]KWX86829.1 MFS transporter [Paenibacillus riograndensis]CQR55033.1 transporter, major facilitator family protein [Paenibacillus riograndensis SBR5]
MATLLLVVIYIIFISLGIPDSLFGAAWPAIYDEFSLPVSAAGSVTFTISACTTISSLLSARLINKYGTAKLTTISVFLTATALLGFSLSPNIIWFCLFALPLGLGAGAVDAALNNYVALYYKASHMNLLHCFYGLGVSVSPYIMSLALSQQNNWRGGYSNAFWIQIIIALIALCSLPLWKKVNRHKQEAEDEVFHIVSITTLFKLPSARAVFFILISSCAIEYTAGIWGSTFLVNTKGLTAENAAKCLALYYIGLATGRLLAGLAATRLSSWKLIYIGQSVLITAIFMLMLPLPTSVSVGALLLIGLGNAPIFPNILHLTPQNFGKEYSQSMMGAQMAVSYVGIALMPPLYGILAQKLSMSIFPYFIVLLFCMMLFSIYRLRATLKEQQIKLL